MANSSCCTYNNTSRQVETSRQNQRAGHLVAAELRTSHLSALRGLRFVYWPVFLDALQYQIYLRGSNKNGLYTITDTYQNILRDKTTNVNVPRGYAKSVQNVKELPLISPTPPTLEQGTKTFVLHHVRTFHSKIPSMSRFSLKQLQKIDRCPIFHRNGMNN